MGMQKELNLDHKLNRKKQQQERDINSWNITIGGHKEVIRILKELYSDACIYLKRKQERAMIIIDGEKFNE